MREGKGRYRLHTFLIALTVVIGTSVQSNTVLPPGLDFTCKMEYKAVNPNADFNIFAGRDFKVDCKVVNRSDKKNGGGSVKIIPPDEWTVHGRMDFKDIAPRESVEGTFIIRAPARSTYRPKVFPVIAELRLAGGAVVTKAFMVELADPFMPSLAIRSADAKSIKASITLQNLYPGQEIKGVSAYAYMSQGIKVTPGRQTFDFPARKSLSLTYSKDDEPSPTLRAVSIGMKADEHIVRLRSVMEAFLPLGVRPRTSGLWMNDFADGQTAQAEIGGKQCRQTVKNESGDVRYMYFAVSPNVPASGNTCVTLAYFDGPEGAFTLQYDARDSAYKESGDIVRLAGTNQWKQKIFILQDIRFENRQNAESDFRLAVNGADLAVSDIAVSKFDLR